MVVSPFRLFGPVRPSPIGRCFKSWQSGNGVGYGKNVLGGTPRCNDVWYDPAERERMEPVLGAAGGRTGSLSPRMAG